MIVVAVCIYDRFYNLQEWIRCWKMCATQDAELVIVHNYANEPDRDSYTGYCAERGIKYIPRVNVGFDIGAFQDVCKNRLEGFPEFDYLLWVTDDALPMRKDFVYQYLQKMPGVAVAAMAISTERRTHIRTTGFMITKEVCSKLKFPADPITTKEECYHFEHRGGVFTMMNQIIRMGYKVVQVTPKIEQACFWDSGFRKYRSREKEHYSLFPKEAQSTYKVAFICPVYNSYPEIISSLINQTHKEWRLFLIHDGPSEVVDIKSIVEATKDERITYIETTERQGNWGHGYRREYLQKLKGSDFDFIVITNADNHHVPTYCEYMIKGFKNGEVAVYHSQMIHSYLKWAIINCKLAQGYLDCAGMMIRKDVACEAGWPNIEAHSADWLYFENIIKKYGAHKIAKVEGCLLSHN